MIFQFFQKIVEFGGFGPGKRFPRRFGRNPTKKHPKICLGGDFLGQKGGVICYGGFFLFGIFSPETCPTFQKIQN